MKKYIAARFRDAQGGLSLDTEALRRYGDVIDLSIGRPDHRRRLPGRPRGLYALRRSEGRSGTDRRDPASLA